LRQTPLMRLTRSIKSTPDDSLGAADQLAPVEWEEAPDEARAVVVDANNPQWLTRYGTELGRTLLAPRQSEFPAIPDAYAPPLVGTWLTRTIQAGTQDLVALVGAPDGRVFAAISGDGLRVYTPSVASSTYSWSAIHTSAGGLITDNVTALEI